MKRVSEFFARRRRMAARKHLARRVEKTMAKQQARLKEKEKTETKA